MARVMATISDLEIFRKRGFQAPRCVLSGNTMTAKIKMPTLATFSTSTRAESISCIHSEPAEGSSSTKDNSILWGPVCGDAILRQNQFGEIEYNHRVAATLRTDNTDFERKVREALARDQVAQDILENLDNEEDFEERDGMLTYQGLIYVPASCRKELVDEFHGAQPHGHQGSAKTLERITRTYYFPHMRRFVEDALRKCNTCRKAKHDRHRPYGLMKSPKTPTGAWTSIALDFIEATEVQGTNHKSRACPNKVKKRRTVPSQAPEA